MVAFPSPVIRVLRQEDQVFKMSKGNRIFSMGLVSESCFATCAKTFDSGCFVLEKIPLKLIKIDDLGVPLF